MPVDKFSPRIYPFKTMVRRKNETQSAGKKTAASSKRTGSSKPSSGTARPGTRKTTRRKTTKTSRTVLTRGVADISRDKTARKLSKIERERKKRSKQISRIKTTSILLALFFGLSAVLLFIKVNFFTGKTTVGEQIAVQTANRQETEPSVPDTQVNMRQETGTEQNQVKNVAAEKPVASVKPESPRAEPEKTAPSVTDEKPEPQKNLPSGDEKEITVPPGSGVLCFVFDDAGHNLVQLEPFLNLPFPCTIAVLPGLPHSVECADEIRGAGKELILHQPMQAVNMNVNPGPNALLPDMTQEEIRAVVKKNLEEIGPVAGLNNHEGSLITADKESMEAVFDVIEENSIFFLDSRTNAQTTAPEIARERGIKIWERAVFLDNSQNKEEIEKAVRNGLEIASKKGYAIMIGHVWSDDLAQLLSDLYPELTEAGYSLCDISGLQTKIKAGDI